MCRRFELANISLPAGWHSPGLCRVFAGCSRLQNQTGLPWRHVRRLPVVPEGCGAPRYIGDPRLGKNGWLRFQITTGNTNDLG